MKNRKVQAAGLISAMVILLAGCQPMGRSVELISSPELSGEKQTDMITVLKGLLPEGAEYATAKKSEPKQSVFTEDMDQDGRQEGIALYYDTKENQPVHMVLIKEDSNGSFSVMEDIDTGNSYLDYFALEDLNEDGKKEVIIGTGIADTLSDNQLSIYEVTGDSLKKNTDLEYEWLQINDYDNDKKPDLFVLWGEDNTSRKAGLYRYQEGQLDLRTSVELNPEVTPENIISGKLAGGENAVFIDSGWGAHSMLTEIIAFEKDKLIKVGDDSDGVLLKEYPLYSKDLNQDGIIEVGGMVIPKGYEEEAFAAIPFLYTYNDYRLDGTKQIIEQRYSDDSNRFFITFPVEWYNKITIEREANRVRLISTEDQQTLFEVEWTEAGTYNGTGSKLAETKDTVFYTKSEKATPISTDNFHLLEEEF